MTLETDIANYEMSAEAKSLLHDTKLLLIAGVVGGGKNTVINEIVKSENYHLIVSHTTRSPRVNHGIREQEGVDYHFIDIESARRMIHDKAFIEAKYVHGNVYGTSVAELQLAHDNQKIAATDVDVQGLVEYLDVKPDTHAIFLLPPSVETWMTRLERRYGNLSDHQDEIAKRFQTAYDEIKHIQSDERFVLVINDDLATTVERVEGVLDGSVSRTSGYAEAVTEHLLEFLATKI